MSLLGHINTQGLVPYVWSETLFIIDGGVRGSLLPTIYGTPYLYEKFPWGERKKYSYQIWEKMAQENDEKFSLFVDNLVLEKMKELVQFIANSS